MKRTLSILLLAGILYSTPSWAGAWLQEPGTAYVRFSSGRLTTRERFDENGTRVQWDTSGGGFRNARYRDLNLHLYAEVGVARDWNAILSGGWNFIQAEQPSAAFETYGLSDVTLGIKRKLTAGPRAVTAAAVYLTVPTGYDPEDYPALGSHVTDVSLALMAGASGNRFWGTGEVEYRLRGGVFRNQVLAAVGGGWNPASRVGLRGEVRGGLAVGSARALTEIRFDPATVDPDYLQLSGTASYRVVKGMAVEVEVRSTVDGENTLAGTRWSLAVATSPGWRFRK